MSFYQKLEKDFQESLKKNIAFLAVSLSKEFDLNEEEIYKFLSETKKVSPPSKPRVQKKMDEFLKTSELSLSKASDNEEVEEKKKSPKKEVKKEVKREKKEEKVIDKEALASDKDLDIRKLLNSNLTELKALCKRHGLKQTGKKEELIKRLQGKEGEEGDEEQKPEKKEPKKKSPTKKEKEGNDVKVLKKIEDQAPIINVRRNEHGNLMHQETKLVMDKETKEFYGKQLDDGSVTDLSADDIETCKKYNLTYRLPENLDKNKKGLDDVKIEEIDNDKTEIKEEEEEVEYEEVEEEVEYEYEEVEVTDDEN